MGILIPLGILALFVVIVAVSVRVDRRKKAAASEARASLAKRRGWRYEPSPSPLLEFRISGAEDGIAWTLEHESDGDSGKLKWRTDSLRARRAELLIVHRTADNLMQSRFGKWLGRTMAEGDKLAHGMSLYGLPHRVEAGGEEFGRQFVARAQEPALARQVLDRAVRDLLARQPSASVAFTARGLEIEDSRAGADPDALEHLVRLGLAVARHLHSFKVAA